MSNAPKPWGTIQTDDETSQSFIVVTPTTTLRVAGNQIKERDYARFFFLVVPQDSNRFLVMRWIELEQLAQSAGSTILDQQLGTVLAGRAPVESFQRDTISYRDALSLRRAQPGQRVVVIAGGTVAGIFVADSRSGDSTPAIDLFALLEATPAAAEGNTGVLSGDADTTPKERQINAWIDDDRGTKTKPLVKGQRAILHFDVALPRDNSLVQGASVGDMSQFAEPDQTSVAMTFMIESDPEQLLVLGAQEFTIPVPLKDGPSEYEALFQIKPLVAGELALRAYVMVKDQLLQKITLTLSAVESQQAAEGAGAGFAAMTGDAPPIAVVSGRTLGSIGALRDRSNPISLIISPTTTGYDLLLTGGVAARARITLNDYGVAEQVQKARNELRKIVYGTDSGSKAYLLGWDVPEEVHQDTIKRLARIGSTLFDNLFYKSGPDAQAMGDLIQKISLAGTQLNIEIVAQNFIFPWAIVYDKPTSEPVTDDGFWGFKHIIHHLPESNAPVPMAFQPVIEAKDLLDLTFVFNQGIDQQMGLPLIASQRDFFQNDLQGIRLTERSTEDELVNDLANPKTPMQILYLYCHAESYVPGDHDKFNVQQFTSDSRLLIDTKQGLSVSDLEYRTNVRVVLESAPFVYLNACQGAELSPFMAGEGLVPFFIRKGARGVLGTECDTPALFAAEFAKRFFKSFVKGDTMLGQLLLDLRKEFLNDHKNVMGLLYSLYSSGDVSVSRG